MNMLIAAALSGIGPFGTIELLIIFVLLAMVGGITAAIVIGVVWMAKRTEPRNPTPTPAPPPFPNVGGTPPASPLARSDQS